MANKRVLDHLPFYVLLVSLVLKLLLKSFAISDYWYDEIIVTAISKQNIPLILDTIRAEPHPPGFYILLKMLPVDEVFKTRFFISLVSYTLIFLGLIYGYRKKIITKYKLSLGLSLFFSSYTFLTITSNVKQDSISLSLLLIYFFTWLRLAENRTILEKRSLFFSHFLLLLLLAFGYVPYVLGLIGSLAVAVYLKRHRLPTYLAMAQIVVLLIYLSAFGFEQLSLNLGRFRWFGDYNNSLLSALDIHLVGAPAFNFFTDTVILIFLSLLAFSIVKGWREVSAKVFLLFFIPIPVLIFLSYPIGAFVRIRYVWFLFLLLAILAGWGLLYLTRQRKGLAFLVVSMFLLTGMNVFQAVQIKERRFARAFIENLTSFSESKKFGFISEHPLFAFVFSLRHPELERLIPVSVFHPNLFEEAVTIEKEHLLLEGEFYDLPEPRIAGLLGKNNLTDFFYLLPRRESETYFDPERKVLRVLSGLCLEKKIVPLEYDSLLFVFQSCEFQ